MPNRVTDIFLQHDKGGIGMWMPRGMAVPHSERCPWPRGTRGIHSWVLKVQCNQSVKHEPAGAPAAMS